MKKIFSFIVLFFSISIAVYAATIGVIDSTDKYAKILAGPHAGTQIDFRPNDTATVQAIEVRNDRIRGYAWGQATGYIVFSCEDTTSGCSGTNGNFKVINNGSGVLSGYAWGESTGWISFSCSNPTSSCAGGAGNWGVTISSGEFSGHAWSQNFGYIKFDCGTVGACLRTDWAPGGTTTTTSGGGSGSGTSGTSATSTTTTGTTTTTTGTTTGADTGGDTTGTDTGTTDSTSTTGTTTGADTGGDTTGGDATSSGDTGTTGGDATTGGDSSTGSTGGDSTGGDSGGSSSGTGGGSGSTGGGIFGGGGIIEDIFGKDTLVSNISVSVSNEVKKVSQAVSKKAKQVVKVITSPEFVAKAEEVTTTTVPVAGAAAGLMATLVSLFFTQAVSLSELLFLPLRIWSLLLIFFGVTKKPWGVVYDSLNKQPIDPAYVTLIDVTTGEEVASSLTDINGRYGFDNIKKGRYRIEASKTHYKFPSDYLKGKLNDEIYEDLYAGQEFDVLEDGVLITKNIPIDAESIDWNEVAKREQNLMSFNPIRENRWQKIAHAIFILGFIVSNITIITKPTLLNKGSLAFYIVSGIAMYVVRMPKIRAKLSRSHALVIEIMKDAPLPFAMVEIKNPETGVVVTKRVTNQDGLFYALLEKGEYKVDISKSEKVGSYTKVFESDKIEVKKGFMSSKFEV